MQEARAVESRSSNSAGDAGDAAGQAYWDTAWRGLPPFRHYEGPVYEQHAVLRRFLSTAGGGEAIEIGCVPGNFMIYLNKEFGYRVSGVDYSEHLEYARQNLRFNRITDVELFHADFFKFDPGKRYDLVFSSGFVEHFDDSRLVIARHVELAKPGGLIVIMVPNLRYVHWVLSRIFHPAMLAAHRFPLMRKHVLRFVLRECGADVLYCEYHRTFRPVYTLPAPLDWASRGLQKALRIAHLDNIPNPFASPYLIAIARRAR